MSGGKQRTSTDNTIDEYSRSRMDQSRQRIMGLLDNGTVNYGSNQPVGYSTQRNPYPSYGQVPGFNGEPSGPFGSALYRGIDRANPTISDGMGGYMPTGEQPLQPISGGPSNGIDFGATELSDYERRAGQLAIDNIGSYEDGLGEIRDMVRGAEFTPGTLDPMTFEDFNADVYVNPYADDIISRTTGDIEEAAARTRNGIKAGNLAQGAYGGSRHGVADALTNEAMLDSIADMSASTRFNVWNQGADRFYQDVGNDMSAQIYNNDQLNQRSEFDLGRAGMLSDLLGQERGLQDQDIERLMGLGATERGVADSAAMRRRDDYWRRVQAELGLLSSVPTIVDGESTTRTSPGALGIAGGIADIYSTFRG